MLAMIQSLGDQLRWAATLDAPVLPSARDYVFVGMGGSGIAGDYVRATTIDSGVRILTWKGYGPLPAWVDDARPTVVGVSYSGNTEETVDALMDAAGRGLTVGVISTDGKLLAMAESSNWPTIVVPPGLQPRAAIGYLVGACLRWVGDATLVNSHRKDIAEAADVVDAITKNDSEEWALAKQIAAALVGRISIVYGGGNLSGTAAQRWKTQINENAKMPAWWSLLPELDHNEIVGWETLPGLTKASVGIVGLTDRSDHARIEGRIEHTRALTSESVPWIATVPSRGVSPLARIFSLTAIGDLMAWMLAESAGVDPVGVGTLEKLKELLVEDAK